MLSGLNRSSEYAYHFVGLRGVCAYCGDSAETEDHTIPSWYINGNIAIIIKCKLYKVACCHDCNVRARDIVDRTFLHRKRRIALSIREKFKKVLGVADWPPEELQKLGHQMRTYVMTSIHEQRRLLMRLELLDSSLIPDGMPNDFFSELRDSDVT